MAITKYVLDPDRGLPPEELARLKELEKELENWEDEYDEDCPELTDEQIKKLKRVDSGKKVPTYTVMVTMDGKTFKMELRGSLKPIKPVIKGTSLVKYDRIFLDRAVVKQKNTVFKHKRLQDIISDTGLNKRSVSEDRKLKNFRKANPG